MNLYDILAEGFHTPLTAVEIADLFRAGRLGRNDPCKSVAKKDWRTVDELFPLLKYDTSDHFRYSPFEIDGVFAHHRGVVIVACAFVAALLALIVNSDGDGRRLAQASVSLSQPPTPPLLSTNGTSQDPDARSNALRLPPSNVTVLAEPPVRRTDNLSQLPTSEEHRLAEQQQREQTRLGQERLDAAEKQRVAQVGRDEMVPLDQFVTISDVGGSSVSVKIHDNDVTSFDVWINGARQRNVRKEKGNTHTRTDETLIYQNGKAKLYFVWEISGTLNSCILRVREE